MRLPLAILLGTGLAQAPYAVSWAQNPQPAPPGVQHAPVAPPSAASPPPEKVAPGALSGTNSSHNLSDKLSRQNGTLQPPSRVDPGMTVNPPAHAETTMPVIPPPGTAGGDQKIQPK